MKRKLSFIVACSLISALLLTSCSSGNNGKNIQVNSNNLNQTGLPLVKEKETISIAIVQDPIQPAENVDHWKEIEKQTNVHVEWTQVSPSVWSEKKGLLIASNQLPDAFLGMNALSDLDLSNYGSQGIILPIEDLAKKWAPNFTKALEKYPELKKQITTRDDHIYAIPGFDDGATVSTEMPMYINKTWLDKLKLPVPTTTDELVTVLKAFKSNDPNGNGENDEIPMTWHKDRYPTDWFGAFGILCPNMNSTSNSNNIILKDGKVAYAPIQPEYKEALKYFRTLYKDGLIDIEAFTQDTATFNAKRGSKPNVVGVMQVWKSNGLKDYIPIAPLTGPDGHKMWPEYPTGLHHRGNFAITSSAKNPELLMRWADNCLADDNALQMAFSAKIGPNWQKNSDGTIKVIMPPAENPVGASYAVGTGKFYFVTKENGSRFEEVPSHIAEKNKADKLYKDYYPKEVFPNIFFDNNETEQLSNINNDLAPFVKGKFAKWIMEGGIEQEWDAYVAKLNDMRLDKYILIHQEAFEYYNSIR